VKRLLVLGILAALAIAVVPQVSLAGSQGKFLSSGQASSAYGRFLPPDEAFRLSAHPRSKSIVLDWKIHDGYYLYRSRFKVQAGQGRIGKAQFPPGVMENDPNFGRVEIYRREVRAAVPVRKIPSDGKIPLTVTYQGCAARGICYPPITRHVTVNLHPNAGAAGGGGSAATGAGTGGAAAAGGSASSGSAGGGAGSAGVAQSQQGHLASLVEHANPFWFFVVFFALGVLLSFTPCVLPMVPILAGVLGKNREKGGAKRGFLLSLTYVLAMAAIYTGAGVAAGYVGVGLQGFFQTPWIIALLAAVFVALALSLFGVYEFRLPVAVTNRLGAVSSRRAGATFYGAAGMGALAALVVSPCVAAPIAGALIAIGQAGVPARGGIALAALSLGMGAPLLVYGTVAGRLLPKAGPWMIAVERVLGIAMLAYAVWLLGRVIPAPVTLILWGATGLLGAYLLGVFKRPVLARGRGWARGAGLLAGLAGLALIIGGAGGGTSPFAPFAGLRAAPQTEVVALNYHSVNSVAALKTQLAKASAAGQPVMVEFRADWCTDCLQMEHTTLRQPAVRHALSKMRLLQVDVTQNTAAERKLLKQFGLYGPPAYIFFNRSGRPLQAQDVVGYLAADAFLPHLYAVLQETSGGHNVANRGSLHRTFAATDS
jgi:thiol:disulfide interchange protein DsbD